MYAKFKRRIDHAERAVPRKRRQLTGPITITVVRTIIPASTSTSSIPSTSSTSTSFSSTSISSSTTTSSVITATSTTVPPPITPSGSTSSLPTSTISSSSSPSTTIEPVAGSAASSSRLSFGAIVGVVIGCVVALVIAIFLCTLCTRKRYQRDRARLRSLWASKDPAPGLPGIMGGFEPKPYTFTPNEQTAQVNPSTLGSAPVPVPIVQVAPPPASYSNVTLSASPAVSNLPVYSQGTQLDSPFSTTVVCTFLPSLPDELSINIGDTIRVLAEYDDGWALCMSMNGEQGMVPLECLDQQAGSFRSSGESGVTAGGLGVPRDREVRRSRRVSSLDPNAKALKAYQ
ncbi:unnamed protein product [Cyclocybe aegerita]|uniref:SH3 domain-containing protein n=1 Tax=Cyclocybe aegerita TaxID=1973307 RepID=A0A8S0VUV4_CYCAE|nr:unnamed protein product [Cyclocybe aegerita]